MKTELLLLVECGSLQALCHKLKDLFFTSSQTLHHVLQADVQQLVNFVIKPHLTQEILLWALILYVCIKKKTLFNFIVSSVKRYQLNCRTFFDESHNMDSQV
ncbi:hypothetical protein O6H91_Y247500 [Diphasiastrum complanatum]|nr:hypothetical protein O6H91_Y247500 [Diphasiastrum complanatum]